MSSDTVLYLSRSEIEGIDLPMLDIIDAIENVFKEKGSGRFEMPPKPGIHTRENAFIHAMPAYIPSMGSAGIKWVSGYPGNVENHLPYISGLLILNDPNTGFPIAIMDATWITAKRTGAATAVAAKYLARPDSASVGIIACGVQGRSNLEALSCIFDLKKVKAYDIRRDVADVFAEEMASTVGTEVEVVGTPKDAIDGMDLVVTSGPIVRNPSPAIEAGWLAEGSFACPLDFDSYWQGDALEQADKLATDDIGQMEHYREIGYFTSTPHPYGDLGEIVTGNKPGREDSTERTISVHLGLALEDMATAILIYRRAIESGVGTWLPL